MSDYICKRCGQVVQTMAEYAAALCIPCAQNLHYIYGPILARYAESGQILKPEKACGRECKL